VPKLRGPPAEKDLATGEVSSALVTIVVSEPQDDFGK